MALVVLRAIFVAVSVGIAVLIFNSETMKPAPAWVPWGVLAGMIALPATVIAIDGALRRKSLTTITAVSTASSAHRLRPRKSGYPGVSMMLTRRPWASNPQTAASRE